MQDTVPPHKIGQTAMMEQKKGLPKTFTTRLEGHNCLKQPFSTRVSWNPGVPPEVARDSLSNEQLLSIH